MFAGQRRAKGYVYATLVADKAFLDCVQVLIGALYIGLALLRGVQLARFVTVAWVKFVSNRHWNNI